MKPYISLGFYVPSKWRASVVGRELTDLTNDWGLRAHFDPKHGPLERVPWHSELLHAEVRRRSFKTKMAESYHYDGDNTPGARPECALVLWASNNPTLIKWRNGPDTREYQPKPFEVVVFHNLHCLHRRPAGVPKRRWVFRQRICPDSVKHLNLP